MQGKRLAKLEAGLEGREKVLAWLHADQQQGGFLDGRTRYIETNGASGRPLDIEDVESRFIYLCSFACNLRVLELQDAHLQRGLLALCVGRFLRADSIPPDELIELQAFRQALKIFVLHGNSSNFTPTDNFSDIYVQDDRAGANFGANGTWLTLYRASAITGGITTVSTNATGAVRTLTILEVAGLDPSPVDVKNQAGNTFTGGSCNSAVTTTNANDLVLNFCIDNSGSTNWAAQSPWLGVITTTGGYSSGVESQNTGTVGTFTPNWNPSSVGGDYANITIAYKAGSPLKPNTQPSVTIITEMHNGPIAETSGAQS
jgi:hypothetical protein